jgi:hypothetical protein
MPSEAELTALLQRTLDHPKLAPYWHADLPGRRPLRLVKNSVSPLVATLMMHGVAVEVLERSELEDKKLPWFEVRDLRAVPDHVAIRFLYPAEGVAGEVAYRKQGSDWVEEKAEVVER